MALQWPQCVFPVQRNPLHPAPTAASTTSTSTTPVPTPTPTSSPAPRPAENRRADRRADRRVVSAPLFFLLPFPPSKAHHTTSNTFAARRQQPAGALTMVCEQCVHSLHCLLHSLYGLLLLPRTATQSCCAACQKLSAVTHEPVCTKALCTGHCVCLCRLLLPLLLLLLPSSSRRRWQSSLVSLLGRALPPQTGTRRRLRDHTHTSCDRNSRGDGGEGVGQTSEDCPGRCCWPCRWRTGPNGCLLCYRTAATATGVGDEGSRRHRTLRTCFLAAAGCRRQHSVVVSVAAVLLSLSSGQGWRKEGQTLFAPLRKLKQSSRKWSTSSAPGKSETRFAVLLFCCCCCCQQ